MTPSKTVLWSHTDILVHSIYMLLVGFLKCLKKTVLVLIKEGNYSYDVWKKNNFNIITDT